MQEAYDLRSFKPDPIAQAAVNEYDPSFADKYPNGSQWKDARGKWCYAKFDRWRDKRNVNVDRGRLNWRNDYWWFAGVRK